MINISQLEIKLFRFDCNVDYLPYYKTYEIEYTQDECVYDVLNKINEIENFSYESKEKCFVNIDGYFLTASVLVSEVVVKTGTEITIEPISLYRVKNDLVIDTKDYDEKLALFSQYLSEEEREEYENKYKLEYYASHTMIINKDYIGDHSLLIADAIITKNPKLESEILKIISNKDTGILYHTNLDKRVFETRYEVEYIYEKLLAKIALYKNAKIIKKEKSELPEDLEITQYFKGFSIALYNVKGCIYRKLIRESRANYIHLDSRRNDLALQSKIVNDSFSFQIAGEILLEAKDKNADFLIVQDEKDVAVFDGEQKKIEKVVNREIQLPIITEAQFVKLLQGEKDPTKLGCDTHKVKISFLES